MTSRTTRAFWKLYAQLPEQVRRQAKTAFGRFLQDSYHPSLQWKRVHPSEPIYSVRISLDYRAVGVLSGDEIIWFWIGSHADYDNLLKRI